MCLPENADGLVADVVMHHQRLAQLAEGDGVFRSANGFIVLQHALDHAGVQNSDIADRGEPRDLPIDIVEVLRPPGCTELAAGLGHGGPRFPEGAGEQYR